MSSHIAHSLHRLRYALHIHAICRSNSSYMFFTLTHCTGSDLRIMMWFSHFSMSGMTGFKYGAFALAHYALAHREEVSCDTHYAFTHHLHVFEVQRSTTEREKIKGRLHRQVIK